MGSRARRAGPGGAAMALAMILLAALIQAAAAAAVDPDPARPPAVAPAPAKPTAETAGTPATVIDDNQIESVLGKSVLSPTGDDMGRVVDVLVDTTGTLRAAVIDFGGFFGVGSRKIAVDWHALHFNHDAKGGTIVADLPQNRLRVAPVYKEGEPVVVLGRAPDAGKAAEAAPGTPSAAPAAATGATPPSSASPASPSPPASPPSKPAAP